jgi:hypothetical protein
MILEFDSVATSALERGAQWRRNLIDATGAKYRQGTCLVELVRLYSVRSTR